MERKAKKNKSFSNCGKIEYDCQMSTNDYRAFCSGLLISDNWELAELEGNDLHFADIVARKMSRKIVAFCIKSPISVDIETIKQAISAKDYFEVPLGFIISDAPFTIPISGLADLYDIHLINDTDLPHLGKLLEEMQS